MTTSRDGRARGLNRRNFPRFHLLRMSPSRRLNGNPNEFMKITQKNASGETRELMLKEYFLNAYLIAMLKRVGEEVARTNVPERREPALARAQVQNR